MSLLRCSHCGTANRTGSNFCNRCGTELRAQQTTAEEGTPPQPQEERPQETTGIAPTANESKQSFIDQETIEQEAGKQPSMDNRETAKSTTDRAQRADDRGRPTSDRPLRSAPQEEAAIADESSRPADAQDDRPRRLVSGIPGLLDPIRLTNTLGGEELAQQSAPRMPLLTVPADQLRRIRALVAEDPILLEDQLAPPHTAQVRLRLPWLIILLTAAVGIPMLLFFTAPVGKARQWPGVAEAYAAIDALPAESSVWILWAYDPTTAGEMDLVALAMASHLIDRQAQATVISLLPTGLASARRLWRSAGDTVAENLVVSEGVGIHNGHTSFIEGAYLPGGAPALALLAASPQQALIGHTDRAASWLALTADQRPALTIVLSAYPEEVQQWLELVQSERPLSVLAFTGASADPVLRPYLASGQLQGFVSGFDGAAAYQQLRDPEFSRLPATRYAEQLIAQNWGHFALILILILGNLRALWLGGDRG